MISSGTTFKTTPVVGRRAAEVIGEGRQPDVVVDREADELVRTGADRMVAQPRPRALRNDRHDQLDGEGAERLLEDEAHGIRIDCLDAIERAIRALAWRHEVRIDERSERIDHIVRGQLVTVVKLHALAQVDDVGDRVGLFPAFSQAADDLQLRIERQQVVVNQLMHPLRRFVAADARVQAVGRAEDSERYDL